MTIKLMLLKSGEDLIADISEMVVGEEEQRRVVGYYLTKPCLVRMGNSNLLKEESEGNNKKAGFQVSLYPWMPLSADEQIPIPADWLVTMVEPTVKLKEMYLEDVINYGKPNDQSNSTDGQTDSNQSD
jgi:hypothetical protein